MTGKKPAFTIVSINHPDELRAPKTRYAVNSYTHRHVGRRPKQITLSKKLAVSWTKEKEVKPKEPTLSSGPASVEAGTNFDSLSRGGTEDALTTAAPSPLTVEFTGTRRDPFNAYPIEVRGCVEGAVDFWLKEWVPAQIPVFLDNQVTFTSIVVSRMFGLAMSNAETFQSLVAMSQAIREHMLGHGVTAGTSSQVLHHKGMALHALQQRIKSRSSVDETMMLTVLNLLALDLIRFESGSFRYHLSALRQMSTQPNAFNTELQKQIFLGYLDASDVYLKALEYQEKTPQTHPNNDNAQAIASASIPAKLIMSLPSGFRSLAVEQQLSLGLTLTLSRLSVWIDLVNDRNVCKNTAMFWELRPWVDIENLFPFLEASRLASPPSTEKLVCLSMLCLACYILRRFSLSGIFHRMLADLIGTVKAYQPRNESQTNLQIWATTVAAGLANERPSMAYRSSPLVDAVIDSLWNPFGTADPEFLFRQFLSDDSSVTAWSACWSAGLDRKKLRINSSRPDQLVT